MVENGVYHRRISLFVFILLGVLIAVVLFASITDKTKLKTDGPLLAVTMNGNLVADLGNDSIITPLAAGDSVRFVGFRDDGIFLNYLVETKNGQIGWLRPWLLDLPVISLSKKRYPGDTIRLSKPKSHFYRGTEYVDDITGILNNGTKTDDLKGIDYVPALKRENFRLREKGSTKFASVSKFYKKTEKNSFKNIEKEFGPVIQLSRQDSNIVAVFNTGVFKNKTGEFFRPTVIFNSDSIASEIKLSKLSDRNAWLLKYLPLASEILDLPFTSFVARTDIYENLKTSDDYTSSIGKAWNFIVRSFIGLCGFIWQFCTPFIPALILYIILYFPKILYPLPDSAVLVLAIGICVISCYYWLVVMMTWGAYFLWMLLMIPVVSFLFDCFFPLTLQDQVPHTRCQQCRAMYSMYLVNKDFLNSENKSENTSKSHRLGSRTRKWQTWTQVTQGNSTWRENVKDHYEKDTDWRRDHYKEKVRYDYFMLHYKCACCGYKERERDSQRVVLDRKYQGSSNYTTHESSDN